MVPLKKVPLALGALLIVGVSSLPVAALAPICTFTVHPVSPQQGQPVNFDGTGSSDPDGTIVDWAWKFGDGWIASGPVVSHIYASPGTYTVVLWLTDDEGAASRCYRPLRVGINPNMDWNCRLMAFWGDIGGTPQDILGYFGVQPGATDDYDRDIDARKVSEPFGHYVYTWFNRPTWGQGPIMFDWRSPVAEGASKVWGTGIADTWNVKTNHDNGPSGVFDTCSGDLEFPIAASIYITWWFGVSADPPEPLPPADYEFTLQYQGGINAKPAGTKLADATMPTMNQTWDMKAVSQIAVPLWNVGFQPYDSECSDLAAGDTARFKIIVHNVLTVPPVCAFTFNPSSPTAGQSVTFDGSASYDPDGTVVDWLWDFGDGSTGTGETTSHIYTEQGMYEVCLTVTDDGPGPSSATCCQTILPHIVEVSIPLTTEGWHMISLPLEPVNKNILLDRATKRIDPESIFYESYLAGNDPRNRLHRYEPGVGYWTYDPRLDQHHSWYEIGVEPPPGKPHPGPWWQGFWFYVYVPHTVTYKAYPLPAGPMVRYLDISTAPRDYAWMIVGACGRIREPYDPDVTTWPATSVATDITWGKSMPPSEPITWLPTSACVDPGAWRSGYIGLPLSGYIPAGRYCTVSPSSVQYCGAAAETDGLAPGAGYWLDVKDLGVWLKLQAGP